MEYDSRLGHKVVLSAEAGSSAIDAETERSCYYDELAEFSAAMETGSPVRCGAEDAVRTVRTHQDAKILNTQRLEGIQLQTQAGIIPSLPI